MIKYVFLIFGTVFGFILSRAGATTFDFYAQLFLFQDLQLMWVIGVAVGVGIVGTQILRRLKTKPKAILTGEPVPLESKPWRKGIVPGSLLFGMGWGLAGACPGTALVMVGELKLGALFTIAGILLGTYLYGLQHNNQKPSAEPKQLAVPEMSALGDTATPPEPAGATK